MSSRPMGIQFPVYQIDFSAVAAGKRVAATKRRIRWRFGFPNLKALEEGRTGTDCRGEEHEVIIVWSITSGKRQIIMDGREIHFSANRVGVIDFSWNAKGNHVFKTICNATPPLSPQPGYRQYDLLIDGQTFFRMPKVFELGIKGTSAQENRAPGQYNSYDEASPRSAYGNDYGGNYASQPPIRSPRDPSEEDAELQRAIRASLDDAKNHLGEAPKPSGPPDVLSEPPAATNADLLDFDGPASSAASVPGIQSNPSLSSYDGGMASVYSAPPAQQSYLALPSSQPPASNYGAPTPYQQPTPYGAPPPAQYGAPPQQQQYLALPSSQPPSAQYGAPPQYQFPAHQPPPQNQYAAPPPNQYAAPIGGSADDPFAPKAPSHQDVSSNILQAYGGPPAAATTNGYGYGAPPPQPGYYQPGQYQPGLPYNEANGTSVPTMSMNQLTMNEQVVVEEKPTNPFDAVLKKLVNIDHIDEPAEEQMKLTMKQQEDERKKKLLSKSQPLPPAAARVVGSGATLREISTVKPPTKKEVVMMPSAHLFQGDAAMAGAMVEYGAPPPQLQPRGFGVVHMQGQYAAQPQPPPQQGYGGYGYR